MSVSMYSTCIVLSNDTVHTHTHTLHYYVVYCTWVYTTYAMYIGNACMSASLCVTAQVIAVKKTEKRVF
jgi:hypothetical protein